MKVKFIRIGILLFAVLFIATGFSFRKKKEVSLFSTEGLELYFHVPTQDEVLESTPLVTENYNLFLGKTYVGFREALGFKESRGDYSIINEFGYLGKYQFNINTLKMVGVYSADRFMNDAKLQEAAFSAYTSRNKWILRRDIKRYVGRTIGGVRVTESGILAAAHLAGAGNVKKYLRSGGAEGFSDAFGTSIGYYLKKFSGYDTSFIKPNQKAKVRV
ncbi:peptidoglycan-binding protein LysM [Rasiella rasia]|uniref:Peptidoglycan-binding protein LysM n=1 Tax=Rasiella rasia TaxID=2744027 RepID=A0A6G6GQE7_9FLAO|nr:peptidoglycan-binding protein LysM [Rasiella rasia]QIE60694.1 peptidoglycan-binding protein LysM [Rasiella rasia]